MATERLAYIPRGKASLMISSPVEITIKPGQLFDINIITCETSRARKLKAGDIVLNEPYEEPTVPAAPAAPASPAAPAPAEEENKSVIKITSKSDRLTGPTGTFENAPTYGQPEVDSLKKFCTETPESLNKLDRADLDALVEGVFADAGVQQVTEFSNMDKIKKFLTGTPIVDII